MTKKTGDVVMLYINDKMTKYKTFDQFADNGKKLIFWQGVEFYEIPETGDYATCIDYRIITLKRA